MLCSSSNLNLDPTKFHNVHNRLKTFSMMMQSLETFLLRRSSSLDGTLLNDI